MGKTFRNYDVKEGRDGAKRRANKTKADDKYRGTFADEDVWNAKPKKANKKALEHHNRRHGEREMIKALEQTED